MERSRDFSSHEALVRRARRSWEAVPLIPKRALREAHSLSHGDHRALAPTAPARLPDQPDRPCPRLTGRVLVCGCAQAANDVTEPTEQSKRLKWTTTRDVVLLRQVVATGVRAFVTAKANTKEMKEEEKYNIEHAWTNEDGHFFTGEEAVLLLLLRYKSTNSLRSMTWETGRSISALSEAIWFMVRRLLTCSCLCSLTRAPALSPSQLTLTGFPILLLVCRAPAQHPRKAADASVATPAVVAAARDRKGRNAVCVPVLVGRMRVRPLAAAAPRHAHASRRSVCASCPSRREGLAHVRVCRPTLSE